LYAANSLVVQKLGRKLLISMFLKFRMNLPEYLCHKILLVIRNPEKSEQLGCDFFIAIDFNHDARVAEPLSRALGIVSPSNHTCPRHQVHTPLNNAPTSQWYAPAPLPSSNPPHMYTAPE
jgi:hypothetical protein